MPRHQLLCRIPWLRQPAWITLPTLGLSEETNVAKVRYVAEGPGGKLSGSLVAMGTGVANRVIKHLIYIPSGFGKCVTEITALFINYENIGVNVVAAVKSAINAGA